MTTLEDIKVIIAEETLKLHKLNIRPVPVKSVSLVKAKSFYADAWRGLQAIRVSTYYLEAPVDEIRATIMHELLHLVPESGRGHGAEWKHLADQVNRAYPQYHICRVGSQLSNGHDWSLRRAAQSEVTPRKVIRVECPSCHYVWERTRNSNLTLHPEQYRCRTCGVALVHA